VAELLETKNTKPQKDF